MSVLVTMTVRGDTDKFRAAVADRGPEFAAVKDQAVAAGALHHRFGVGDGFVVVIDEWTSLESFQAFFGRPELQAFIADVGGDPSSPPDITVTEAITSADQF
jgi:quinol monooxygenase YgiN